MESIDYEPKCPRLKKDAVPTIFDYYTKTFYQHSVLSGEEKRNMTSKQTVVDGESSLETVPVQKYRWETGIDYIYEQMKVHAGNDAEFRNIMESSGIEKMGKLLRTVMMQDRNKLILSLTFAFDDDLEVIDQKGQNLFEGHPECPEVEQQQKDVEVFPVQIKEKAEESSNYGDAMFIEYNQEFSENDRSCSVENGAETDEPQIQIKQETSESVDQFEQDRVSQKLFNKQKLLIGGKMYECEFCSKTFKQSYSLKIHKLSHTEHRPYECILCHKKFKSSLNLTKHQFVHSEDKPFQCEVCSKFFKRPQSLKEHKRIHTGETPYHCDLCGSRFRSTGMLKFHKRVHTGEKGFLCDLCGKSVSRREHLQIHRRTHTGEKPFGCDVCFKRFRTKGELTVHKRIHTGEKPFECIVCSKKFTTSGKLSIHMSAHSGKKAFGCDVCSKRFVDNCNLVIHKRTHTGEKPYECEVCSKRFTATRDLTRHRRTHSAENTET